MTIQQKVKSGFGIAVGILVVIGVSVYNGLNNLFEAYDWQSHTYSVITQVEELETHLKDAQQAQRGFIISANQRYLPSYRQSINNIWSKFNVLQQKTNDNVVQQRFLGRLEPLIHDEIDFFEKTIEVRQNQGFNAVLAIVNTHYGQTTMERIVETIAQIKAEENRLLTLRRQQSADNVRSVLLTALCGWLIVLLVMVVLYLFINREIINRKKAEIALRESKDRLNFALEGTNDGLWDWNIATGEVYFSPKWMEMLGYKPNELPYLYETWEKLLHPDDKDRVVAILTACLTQQSEFYEVESRLLTKQGQWKWIKARGKIVALDEFGVPQRMVGTHMDIDDNKRTEEKFRVLFESSSDAHLIFDDTGVIDCNDAAVTMMNAKGKIQLLAMHPAELSPEFQPDGRRSMEKCVEMDDIAYKKGFHRFDWLHRKITGETFPVEVSLTPVKLGEKQAMLVVWHDLTERQKREEVLLSAKEAAIEAGQLKSQFLANMSHEIRTPMNGIMGLTEMVLKSDLSNDQRRNLHMIQTSAHTLMTIINDILDFSKIEAGKLELNPMPFMLREMIEETLSLFAPVANQKNLELLYHVHSDVPDSLVGDQSRLRQVLNNLIGNAIKFSKQGEVLLDVGLNFGSDGDPKPGTVCLNFKVADTGIGLKPDLQRRIFEPFIQADGSTTRRYGGTGLGLSISKSLIEMMGGEIGVQSEEDKGSTFYFTAQFDLPENPVVSASPVQLEALEDMPVLVVDDNDTNLFIVKQILLFYGMKPLTLNNGSEALIHLKIAVEQDNAFPLAVLDINMPEMDGFTLAHHIKSDPDLANTQIIMLSSSEDSGDPARCRAMNIAGYLTKPIGERSLIRLIQGVFGLPQTTGSPGQQGITRTIVNRPKYRVLLAEDNDINRLVAEQVLTDAGHTVVTAANGREAVVKFKAQVFDAVLMDIHMPEMDGYDATTAIREFEQGTNHYIPIIAITANAIKGDRERCLDAGMDGYLAKPFQSHELLDILEAVVEKHAKTWTSVAVTESNISSKSLASNASEVLDANKLVERLNGDTALLNRVVMLFCSRYPEQLTAIARAIEAQDNETLYKVAHALKGSIGNFTDKQAFITANQLEMMGRENDLMHAKSVLMALEEEVKELDTALHQLTVHGFSG